ncbi:MAG: hypothetical protein JWM20_577 [Patescibacteria group bacterium]|nr:hypothetical protein [Patescibacteria group bacterium]
MATTISKGAFRIYLGAIAAFIIGILIMSISKRFDATHSLSNFAIVLLVITIIGTLGALWVLSHYHTTDSAYDPDHVRKANSGAAWFALCLILIPIIAGCLFSYDAGMKMIGMLGASEILAFVVICIIMLSPHIFKNAHRNMATANHATATTPTDAAEGMPWKRIILPAFIIIVLIWIMYAIFSPAVFEETSSSNSGNANTNRSQGRSRNDHEKDWQPDNAPTTTTPKDPTAQTGTPVEQVEIDGGKMDK